jgi:hypothetical protein
MDGGAAQTLPLLHASATLNRPAWLSREDLDPEDLAARFGRPVDHAVV